MARSIPIPKGMYLYVLKYSCSYVVALIPLAGARLETNHLNSHSTTYQTISFVGGSQLYDIEKLQVDSNR